MSWKANLVRIMTGIMKYDRKMAQKLTSPVRGPGAFVTDDFTKKVRVKTWDISGFRGVTINGSYPKNLHILMLPGGYYTLEAEPRHREIAERFALRDHMRVSVLEYPLTPEYSATDTHHVLLEAYERLVEEYPEDRFFLIGDSSGGGLALAFLQQLRDMGTLPMPVRTAVVSPWLDISLSNPMIKIARKTDRILPVEELQVVGEHYRGSLHSEDPLVSPIYGDWNHLGPVLIFAGTEEIMTPDCELLMERAKTLEGTELIFKKADKMIHDWILLRIKEADVTLDLIAAFFLEILEEKKETTQRI